LNFATFPEDLLAIFMLQFCPAVWWHTYTYQEFQKNKQTECFSMEYMIQLRALWSSLLFVTLTRDCQWLSVFVSEISRGYCVFMQLTVKLTKPFYLLLQSRGILPSKAFSQVTTYSFSRPKFGLILPLACDMGWHGSQSSTTSSHVENVMIYQYSGKWFIKLLYILIMNWYTWESSDLYVNCGGAGYFAMQSCEGRNKIICMVCEMVFPWAGRRLSLERKAWNVSLRVEW
jgi:hypothetical protein